MFILIKSVKTVILWAALSCCFSPLALAQNTNHNLMLLSESQVNSKIQTLPQWETDGKALNRTFVFANFVEAIAFVNKLVEPAEAAGHHPDLAISYNKVSITLTTHDAGGLTNLDFSLAEQISNLVDE